MLHHSISALENEFRGWINRTGCTYSTSSSVPARPSHTVAPSVFGLKRFEHPSSVLGHWCTEKKKEKKVSWIWHLEPIENTACRNRHTNVLLEFFLTAVVHIFTVVVHSFTAIVHIVTAIVRTCKEVGYFEKSLITRSVAVFLSKQEWFWRFPRLMSSTRTNLLVELLTLERLYHAYSLFCRHKVVPLPVIRFPAHALNRSEQW